jgi:hypothetical protein
VKKQSDTLIVISGHLPGVIDKYIENLTEHCLLPLVSNVIAVTVNAYYLE